MPTYLLVLFHIGPAAAGVYHALLFKRDPRAAMGWIMACIFIPYGGPVAYFLFGINRVRTRAQGMHRRLFEVPYEHGARRVRPAHDGEPGMRDAGWRITGHEMSVGNEITPLYNGEAAYTAMLGAIAEARNYVFMATYILRPDEIGTAFAQALQSAVVRGVDVKVLVDGIGELYAWPRSSALLRRHKVPVARFLPPKLFPPSMYINLRNHRKLLIVDDQVAFAGGMNIGDDHTSTQIRSRKITDVHFSLQGPVVQDLTELFCNDWHFATQQPVEFTVPRIRKYDSNMNCRVVPDGPDGELDKLATTIQTVISAAKQRIDIMTPYFLPNRELMSALESAVLRGVHVRVVLPEKSNLPYVQWAHRNMLAEMLRWDIETWYQPEPFSHTKLMCIDDDYSMVGSANLDARSLRLNFELGIEVFSRELNAELTRHFNEVIEVSLPVDYDDLARRSLAGRLRDSAATLMTPYL